MTRRSVGLCVAGVLAAGAVAIATPASATISTPPPSVANTGAAQVVTVADSNPSTLYTVPPAVQLTGPGSGTDTYNGTAVGVMPVGQTCLPPVPPLPPVCIPGTGTSSISSTFNLIPGGLPAGPGDYTLSVCLAACPVSISTTTLHVTGAAPAPGAQQFVVQQNQSKHVSMAGTGYSKGNNVTAPAGITFTPDNPQGTATALNGTIHVDGSVADGTYDLTVHDTASQTGVCTGCLVVGQPTPPRRTSKLTLHAPSKVNGAKKLVVTGQLTAGGDALAHQAVGLFGRPDGGKIRKLAVTKTSGNGDYKFSVKLPSTMQIATLFLGFASSPGKAGATAVLSTPKRVVLTPSIKAHAKKSTSHLKPLVVKGVVKPVESGQSVSVVAKHAGKTKRLGTAKVNGTHFRLRTKKLTKPGKYKIVVTLASGHGHAAAKSKAITIKRT